MLSASNKRLNLRRLSSEATVAKDHPPITDRHSCAACLREDDLTDVGGIFGALIRYLILTAAQRCGGVDPLRLEDRM
jgi:hypothetical protein